MKACPVLGCTQPLSRGYVMCPPDWGAVPRTLRQELRAAMDSHEVIRINRAYWQAVEFVGAWKSPLRPEPCHADVLLELANRSRP